MFLFDTQSIKKLYVLLFKFVYYLHVEVIHLSISFVWNFYNYLENVHFMFYSSGIQADLYLFYHKLVESKPIKN